MEKFQILCVVADITDWGFTLFYKWFHQINKFNWLASKIQRIEINN